MSYTDLNQYDRDVSGEGQVCPGQPRRALVVFSGASDLKWLRWLKPGYRHCFALVQSNGYWVMYNPLSTGTEVEVWPCDHEPYLRTWLSEQGYQVIEQTVRPLLPKPLPWAPYSCVEAVKRVLGLRVPGVLTPWQLYRYIKNDEKGK